MADAPTIVARSVYREWQDESTNNNLIDGLGYNIERDHMNGAVGSSGREIQGQRGNELTFWHGKTGGAISVIITKSGINVGV